MKKCLSLIILFSLLIGFGYEVQSQSRSYSQIEDLEFEITYKRKKDNSIDFNFKKYLYGSFYVSIKFNKLENAKQYICHKSIRGGQGRIFNLRAIESLKRITFSYSYRYVRGKYTSRLNKEFVYLLPYKSNTEVDVKTLGNLDEMMGDEAPDSWKAFQFSTEESEPILAARRGLVVEVVDKHKADSTKDYTFNRSVNKVLIEHKDGTLASYTGFKNGSIKVKEGQYVYPQEELGYSGKFDSGEGYKLQFCIYYLNANKIRKQKTLKTIPNMYAYLHPHFHWKGGEAIILPRNDYVAEATEELIMQEFSRREKKKYLKGELN